MWLLSMNEQLTQIFYLYLTMKALMKDYALTTDEPKLSGFISLHKKAIVQYLFNLNIVEWEDIRAKISKCCGDVKSVYKVCRPHPVSLVGYWFFWFNIGTDKRQEHGGLGWPQQYNQTSMYCHYWFYDMNWITHISNCLQKYKAFMMIEKNQSDALLNQAREHRQVRMKKIRIK